MKGIDKLIYRLALTDCPSAYWLNDKLRVDVNKNTRLCKNDWTETGKKKICMECWKLAIEEEYKEDKK